MNPMKAFRTIMQESAVVLLAGAVLCMSAVADTAPLRVNAANSDGPWDGTTWATAFQDIQSAVNAAATNGGGEVWVASGVYAAETDPVVMLQPGVGIYGGFAGTESARGERDLSANLTVIDGGTVRRCVVGSDGAVLDGFTVTRGDSYAGGGMYNYYSSPAVQNCVFSGNVSLDCGGALYNNSSSPTVVNCVFTGNTAASQGGAVHSSYSLPTLMNCTFTGNSAGDGSGGAVYDAYFSTATVTNCILWHDTATRARKCSTTPIQRRR